MVKITEFKVLPGYRLELFFDDHNPPHFHAEYSADLALIDIRNLSVFSGRLPPRSPSQRDTLDDFD